MNMNGACNNRFIGSRKAGMLILSRPLFAASIKGVTIHANFVCQFRRSFRRYRTLGALVAFANTAGDADLVECVGVVEIEAIGIGERFGMRGLAAERDGVAANGGVEAGSTFGDRAGERNVAYAVRGLGELADDAAGLFEGLVDVPKRAGRGKAGELEFGGAVAFGNGAGAIDPNEEEGDAAGAWALQRG